jgi:hypothetical protein
VHFFYKKLSFQIFLKAIGFRDKVKLKISIFNFFREYKFAIEFCGLITFQIFFQVIASYSAIAALHSGILKEENILGLNTHFTVFQSLFHLNRCSV